VPLGAFLVLHLASNASSLGGARAFNAQIDRLAAIPLRTFGEMAFIAVPLAFHALAGVWLAVRGDETGLRRRHGRGLLHGLQRATGILALLFIGAHLWEFRVQRAFFGLHAHALFGAVATDLSSVKWSVPWIAIGYVLGLGSVVFHLANGIVGFATSWGLAASERSVRRLSWASGAIGTALFALGMASVVFFSTGQSVVPVREPEAPPCAPGPAPAATANDPAPK
jgi:succinate dehydrogenase / fumarate reductase cytochrome b subunit